MKIQHNKKTPGIKLSIIAGIAIVAIVGTFVLNEKILQPADAQNAVIHGSNTSPQVVGVQWPPAGSDHSPAPIQHITVIIGVNNTVQWTNEGEKGTWISANNMNDPDFAKAAPYFGSHFDGALVNSTQVGPNETEIFYKDISGQVSSFFSEPARYAANILDERTPFFEYTFTQPGTFGYHGSDPWERSSVTVLTPLSSASAPEFPFVVPVLLTSITSLIIFYRVKLKLF